MKKYFVLIFSLLLSINSMFAQNKQAMNNTALLIIDIQNDYFDGGANPLAGSNEAGLNAKQILQYARTNKMPVVHIQHLSTRPGSGFFIPGTAGAEIHAYVAPVHGEKVIVKHYPNSFRETGLLQYLQSENIQNLIICGMMTHMCVDATVRAAKDYNLNCTVIGNACATKDLEINNQQVSAQDVHNAFLAALNYFYADVITAHEYLR